MTSEVAIANMALSRIGVDQTIESLDDTSARARACKLWYAHCRDKALSDAPWNFALRVAALATVSGDPPPGWSYQFRYPADCLAMRDVTDDGGSRTSLGLWWASLEYAGYARWMPPRYPWEVRGEAVADTGKIIVTDLDVPYGLYVRRVLDPNQFTVQFVDAHAWCLAVELAPALKASADMRTQAAQGWASAKSSALAHFMRESRPDREPDSISISCRN